MQLTPELSVVVPCYNEARGIAELQSRLISCLNRLGCAWEVVFVDDGSNDGTFEELVRIHRMDSRFKLIRLSRNFGQQAAICAGLGQTLGRAVAIMDADMQDPPELLERGLEKLKEGYDIVYTVRHKRKEGLLKRTAYRSFYKVFDLLSAHSIPANAGDFCVMTRQVVEVLVKMQEQRPFVRGLRAWAGFRQIGLDYERGRRTSGKSSYSLSKLAALALDGIFSFSFFPLRLPWIIAFFLLVGALMLSLRAVAHHQSAKDVMLIILLLLVSGLHFLFLGCMGEYIARIYEQGKQRPRWIIAETLGLDTRVAFANTQGGDPMVRTPGLREML